MFDAERCISCSRCIRFCDEIAKDPELTFIKRGDRVTIVTYPGEQMDNPYSLNTTDICPVGALTNRDFRFRARVWDMSSTESICVGCSRGCNSEIWVRNNEVLRLTPRYNEEVNSYWMCDHGRINTFKFINSDDRINGPHVRRDGTLTKVEWTEALNLVANELKSFQKKEITFIGSPFASNEDNYTLSKLAKLIGLNNVLFAKHMDPDFGDDILRQNDITPNSTGTELAGLMPVSSLDSIIKSINDGKTKALFLIDDDIIALNPGLENVLAKLDLLIVISTNFDKTASLADIVFPSATYAEKNGTMVNFQGIIQRLKPAVTTIELDRSMDGMSQSRLDKFGTKYDRWAQGKQRDAKSAWKIISAISNTMGYKMKYNSVEDVFDEIAKSVEAFKGLDYDDIGESGAKLKIEISAKV